MTRAALLRKSGVETVSFFLSLYIIVYIGKALSTCFPERLWKNLAGLEAWICFLEPATDIYRLEVSRRHQFLRFVARRVRGLVDQSSLIESGLPKQDLRT